jgi:superfamily II DNA or RNA helicase
MPRIVHVPDMLVELTPRAYTAQPDGNVYSLDVEPVAAAEVASEIITGAARENAERERLRDVPMGSAARGGPIRLRDYQVEAVEAVQAAWEDGKRSPLVVMPTGCHRAGQLILMLDGTTKRVEDVVVGDLIMGPHRTPRRVLQLCRGTDEMFEICPQHFTGSGLAPKSFVVNGDHVLPTYESKHLGGHLGGVDHLPPICRNLTVREARKKTGHGRGWLAYLGPNGLVRGYSTYSIRATKTTEPFYGFQLDGDHLYVLPDGCVTHNSGKTIVAAEAIHRYCAANPTRKAMFIAHREELLTQTRSKLMVVSDSISVGIVQGTSNQLGRRVTVASVQTVGHHSGRRLEAVMESGKIGLLIVDEAHHAVAGSAYARVIARLREDEPNLVIMGLTATPDRADGTALDAVFDKVAFHRDIFWMIEHGYLVPPTGVTVKLDIDLNAIATRDGDFVQTQLSKVMNQPAVNFAVVRAWQQHGFDKKMLAFCVDVAHAEALAEAFRDAGYTSAAVHGEMAKKDRERVLDDFRKGTIKLLANCEILVEGYDDPSCEGIIFARPTQSRSLFAQATGRGLRLYPGKTECVVIDVVGNSEKHSLASLASLAGLDPVGPEASDGEKERTGEEDEEIGLDGDGIVQLDEVNERSVRSLDFQRLARRRELRYSWRETTVGWTLQIPRVGYFLVAWADLAHTKCTVHFYDLREGRRDSPPTHVLSTPVDFDLAYGMVEGEMERFMRARASRENPTWGNRGSERDDSSSGEEEEDSSTPASFFAWIDLSDGLSDDIAASESMMMNSAGWRRRPRTAKQETLLKRYGARIKTLPETAGEAADLITVLQVEHDFKMRLPPTDKQLGYLRVHQIKFTRDLTKQGAARLIVQHRRATGRM